MGLPGARTSVACTRRDTMATLPRHTLQGHMFLHAQVELALRVEGAPHLGRRHVGDKELRKKARPRQHSGVSGDDACKDGGARGEGGGG